MASTKSHKPSSWPFFNSHHSHSSPTSYSPTSSFLPDITISDTYPYLIQPFILPTPSLTHSTPSSSPNTYHILGTISCLHQTSSSHPASIPIIDPLYINSFEHTFNIFFADNPVVICKLKDVEMNCASSGKAGCLNFYVLRYLKSRIDTAVVICQ